MSSSKCLGLVLITSLFVILTITGIAAYCWREDHTPARSEALQLSALDHRDVAECDGNFSVTGTFRLVCVDGRLVIEEVAP